MIRALPTALRITWAHRTDVQRCYDGSEVRASTLTLPRVELAGAFMLVDADIRSIDEIMGTGAGAIDAYEMPLAHEATPPLAAISGTAVTIDDTYCDWIAVGRRVLVIGAAESYTAAISAATGGALTLDASPAAPMPVGTAHVVPLEDVLLADGNQGKRYPVNAGRWDWTARQVTPAAVGGAGVTLPTFGGLTVLDRRPLGVTATTQLAAGTRWIDVGGAVSALTAWERSRVRRDGSWLVRSAADRQWAKKLIGTLRGQRVAFLRPTWRPDLTLDIAPTGGSNTIRVTQNFPALWGGDLARQRLQLEYADGSVGYFAVFSSSWTGSYSTIVFTASLPSTIPGGGVRTVSFLETSRLDSDAASLQYDGDWIGRLALTSITVQE